MSPKQDHRTNNTTIYRFQATSDETPPWAGIGFVHPIDSDELSEKLRGLYPECRTLRQRKHMAAIDFLQEELKQMQSQYSTAPETTENVARPSTSSPRNDMNIFRDGYTPDSRPQSAASHTSHSIISSKQSPRESERTRQTVNESPTNDPLSPWPKRLSASHFVFNASDGKPIQPKTKRKMTIQERHAYKETRKRGACETCKRNKARCTHINDVTVQLKGASSFKRATKRSGSQIPDQDPLGSPKLVKTEDRSSARRGKPEKSRHFQVLDIPQYKPDDRPPPTLDSARSFKSAESATDNGQWRTDQSPGYVPNIPPLDPPSAEPPLQGPMAGDIEHGWILPHNSGPMEQINEEYPGDVLEVPGLPEYQLQPRFFFLDPWMSQDPQVGPTG